MRRIVVIVGVLVGLVCPGSAQAIIGGEFDAANKYSNVGMLVTLEQGGGGQICSGTLVAPTIMVTAAHCVKQEFGFPPIERILVSFDNRTTFNPFAPEPSLILDPSIPGTGSGHPQFINGGPELKPGANAEATNAAFDVGVVVLDRPASDVWPGITPAPLPRAGLLDQFATGTRNRLFTIVGYGVQRDITPPKGRETFFDGARNFAFAPLLKLTPTLLYLNSNSSDARGTGGACFGDSGGPALLDEVIVAVLSFGRSSRQFLCEGATSGRVRLDAGIARSFLSQYVSLP
jgi:Trypsin